MGVDEVRTARLLLRRWLPSDRAVFAALNSDPEVMRHFPAPLTRAESDALVDRIERCFAERGWGLWAVEPAATGVLAGFTGLNPMPDGVPGQGGVEVGWRLARSAWGHGYATEGASASLEVAFDRLGLPEVWSITATSNSRSVAVMERIGMRRHGEFEHPRIQVGHPLRLHVAYRLGRDEWLAARGAGRSRGAEGGVRPGR